MTTDEQVTHPPVTHPETITLKVAQERPKKPSDGSTEGRTARRRRPLPPPKVIAAVALVVAALELLIWQVGGVFWGLVIHLALINGVVIVVAVALAWRRRATRRQATARRAAPGPGQPAGRAPRGRLFGGGRPTGGNGAGRTGAPRRRGLLDRLTGGRLGGAGRPTGGVRRPGGLLGRLGRTPGRRTVGAPGRAPGGRTTAAAPGRRLRNLFTPGRRHTAAQPANHGGAGRPRGPRPAAQRRAQRNRRPGRWLQDFLRGARDGARGTQPTAAAERRKPSPGPSAAKPTPIQRQQPPKPQHADTEQMVREAVQQAADANPAAVPTPRHTGGSYVGDMNRVRAAADDLAAALKDYDPETMHQMVRELPGLEEALNAVSAGVRQMASRAESEWPVAAPVAEALRSVSDDLKAGAGTAGEARNTVRSWNETDIERGEAPRHGSRHIESKWDVGNAD